MKELIEEAKVLLTGGASKENDKMQDEFDEKCRNNGINS